MFLRIKYDVPQLDAKYLCERTTLCIVYKENVIYLLNKMRINILFMNYIDGKLEIDASVPDVFSRDKVSYYFLLDDVRQDVVFNEGYSLTKYFGVSAYKRFTFHASIPLKYTGKQQVLRFAVQYDEKNILFQPNINHTLQDCPMIRQILTGILTTLLQPEKPLPF